MPYGPCDDTSRWASNVHLRSAATSATVDVAVSHMAGG